MIFSSEVFLFLFFPIVLIISSVCLKGLRNAVLLFASLFFYAFGEPKYICLILISLFINYLLGLLIDQYRQKKMLSKALFLFALCGNMVVLLFYKYFNFFLSNLSFFGCSLNDKIKILLPIGISFFSFQVLSYIIDVYTGKVKAQNSFIDLALYISMFPQLIAGPIVRYSDIESELSDRTVSIHSLYEGCKRFMLGFSKKILIADNLAPVVMKAFDQEKPGAFVAWYGVICYTIQIYFDFDGYSDMAIGLGRMFGFTFPENFNLPYISKSVKEFWRRWHMTLSTWFRDYVYIPLGGSRCSKWMNYRNLIVVFLLTGFWHGASWNFIFWGLYYAAFLVFEKMFLSEKLEKSSRLLCHLYTLFVVMFGWIVFRANGLRAAFTYIGCMFSGKEEAWEEFLLVINKENLFFVCSGILFSSSFFVDIVKGFRKKCKDILLILVFIVAILYLVGNGFSPFLYFRF